jgi:hypothetical protein
MNKPSITVRGFNVTDPVGIKSVKKYLNWTEPSSNWTSI